MGTASNSGSYLQIYEIILNVAMMQIKIPTKYNKLLQLYK